jgi:hypothetical protein
MEMCFVTREPRRSETIFFSTPSASKICRPQHS